MRKILALFKAMSLAAVFSGMTAVLAQAPGNWTSAGGDIGHSGWQKAETKISPETTGAQFRFLWKIRLASMTKDAQNFTEPVLAPRLINAQGFKDIVLWASPDTVYAVDSELGNLLWKKNYGPGSAACGTRDISIILEPIATINFGARRAPGAPAPPPPPPTPMATERRLGMNLSGGFALKGVYALTGDGMLHEQVLTTGADFAPSAPAVRFLPPTSNDGLSMTGKTIFTSTSSGCGGAQKSFWSIDLAKPDYPVSSYAGVPLGDTNPTISGSDVFAVTGKGNEHPNSIVALGVADMKAHDWYTPSSGTLENTSPTLLMFKGRKLLAASGGDDKLVLLDTASLGGSDHHTPLAETAKIHSSTGTRGGFASWQDARGAAWVLASVSGPVSAGSASTNGSTPHGSIVAFKVDDASGRMSLTPAWVSQDLINPAPPVVANGVVLALSQGDASTHAKLYVLDAATGKELFNSGDSISTYAHLAGVALGEGHAFFATHDGTLYSFGIAIEH